MNKIDIAGFREKMRRRYGLRFKNYILKDTARLVKKGEAVKSSLRSADSIINYQKELKERFIRAVAGIEYGVKCIEPQVTGVIDSAGYAIEKILFQSAPSNYITANFYKPKTGAARYPAVLFVCGHYPEAKAYPEYQAVIQELVNAGLAVLAVDPMGQGERLNYYNRETKQTDIEGCTAEHSYNGARAWLTGVPLNHYFIRDILCALDYLTGRADVDADRIGMTGNSGGGTQTSLMMLSQDERIKAFAPATYITEYLDFFKTWQASDDEQIYGGMLKDGFNYDDIIISVAPRPVSILAVSRDFFPCEGAVKTYRSAKAGYEALGCGENLELVIDDAPHEYTQKLARNASRFFVKHLLGKDDYESSCKTYDIRPSAELNVTKNGQVGEDFPIARFVWDEIKEAAHIQAETIKNNPNAKQDAVKFLNDKVFYGREYKRSELKPVGGFELGKYHAEAYAFSSAYGLINLAVVYSKGNSFNKSRICFFDYGNDYLLNDNASDHNSGFLDKHITDDTAVIAIDTSNYGFFKFSHDDMYGFPHYGMYGFMYNMSHQMFFRDDSIAALRIFEILSAVRNIKKHFEGCAVGVYTEGRVEILVAVALLLDGGKTDYKFADKFNGFKAIINEKIYDYGDSKSYIIPGILRYCDYGDIKNRLKETTYNV